MYDFLINFMLNLFLIEYSVATVLLSLSRWACEGEIPVALDTLNRRYGSVQLGLHADSTLILKWTKYHGPVVSALLCLGHPG
jgi:hypothetical protein